MVLATGALARRARITGQIGLMIMALYVSVDGWWVGAGHIDSAVPALNIERASERLMQHHITRLVFTWDSPTAEVMPVSLLSTVGGFFFWRSNDPVQVTAIKLDPTRDPNQALLAAAAPRHAAIIWLFDRSVRHTAARHFAVSIPRLDPDYVCNDLGTKPVGSLMCFEPAAAPAVSRDAH